MASEVGICNSAMQKIGAARITSLSEDSRNARACNACYSELRDAELRAHPWNFARKRQTLAADSAAPDTPDFSYQFTLPSDCLKPLPPNTTNLDWQIESNKILTNDGDTLYLKYVYRVTDPNSMDVLFREMLSCRIAIQTCYEISQSNALIQQIEEQYQMARREARKANAFEQSSDEAPMDTWELARL